MANIISFISLFLTGMIVMAIGYHTGRRDEKRNAIMTITYDMKAKIEKTAIIELGATVTEISYNPLDPCDVRIKGIIIKPINEFNAITVKEIPDEN